MLLAVNVPWVQNVVTDYFSCIYQTRWNGASIPLTLLRSLVNLVTQWSTALQQQITQNAVCWVLSFIYGWEFYSTFSAIFPPANDTENCSREHKIHSDSTHVAEAAVVYLLHLTKGWFLYLPDVPDFLLKHLRRVLHNQLEFFKLMAWLLK